MNKKGFTLMEIIISISLITLIGVSSVVGIKFISENIRISELNQITDKALSAAQVYIETNKETYNQLYKKQNAVMIPLNVLVNEGLLNLENTDLTKNDYDDEYVITMLTEEHDSGECIDIKSVTSWDESSNNPIYICPNSGGSSKSVKEELKNKSNNTYFAKGANPNNWVKFEVTSDASKVAYFPNDTDKDLWRIVSIDDNNQIKLIYPKPIPSNNTLNYTNEQNIGGTASSGYTYYYKLKAVNSEYGLSTSEYYRYQTDNEWNSNELLNNVDVEGSKQQALYNQISPNYQKFIIETRYNLFYYKSGGIIQQTNKTTSLKIGMINQNEINSSISDGDSWLFNYSTLIGLGSDGTGLSTFSYNIYSTGEFISWDFNIKEESKRGSLLYTYDFHPAITLNTNVDLIKENCPEGKEPGSKECPYTLKCDSC